MSTASNVESVIPDSVALTQEKTGGSEGKSVTYYFPRLTPEAQKRRQKLEGRRGLNDNGFISSNEPRTFNDLCESEGGWLAGISITRRSS